MIELLFYTHCEVFELRLGQGGLIGVEDGDSFGLCGLGTFTSKTASLDHQETYIITSF